MSKLSIKKNNIENVSGSGLKDLQIVYSRLGKEGLQSVAILAPIKTTVFISDDRHPYKWPTRYEFWLQWSSTSKKTSSVWYKIESATSPFSTGDISA